MECPAPPDTRASKQNINILSGKSSVLLLYCDCIFRMHGNLFLDESVTELLKLDEDFAKIVKDKITADPENMLELNKV